MVFVWEIFNSFFCRAVALASILILSLGCKVGPNYRTPEHVVKSEWTQSSAPLFQGSPSNPEIWWTYFNDPVLEHLVKCSLDQNLSLKQAGEKISEARARRGVAVGNLLPQSQSVDASYSHSKLSSNSANFFSVPSVFQTDVRPDNWSTLAAASWELDFWGRYRRAVESADAGLDASISNADDVAVILLAEVGHSYIEMRTAEKRRELANRNLEIQSRTLEAVKKKKEAGLSTAIDVCQAETNARQTASALPSLELQRRLASNRLCVLLGADPIDLAGVLGESASIPQPREQLAFGVPADILRRRPDVRRAERELASQSARIGIAESEFYPHVGLRGNIGFSSRSSSQLFDKGSQVGVISPQFSWNLLNYSRIRNNVAAEVALFRQLSFAYHNQVLSAMREAEDAQISFILTMDRLSILKEAAEQASQAIEYADTAYDAGTMDYGRIYVLQAELYKLQDQCAQSESEVAQNFIRIFRTLGGGWAMMNDGAAKT